MAKKSGLADVWPLSPMQRGMVFHSMYDQEAPDVYRGQVVFELHGELDVDALTASMQGLLRRHPNLRAAFRTSSSGEPVQLIPREVEVPCEQVDLRGLPAEEEAQRLADVLDQDWEKRFDLATPPLLRLTTIRLGQQRSRIALTLHHILSDGWSTSILANELLELYQRGGDDTSLPPVTPYRSYLAWLARQDQDAAHAAWQEALDGAEPTLVAPAESARAAVDPQEVRVTLPSDLVSALEEYGRKHGVTPNTIFRGAWALLLGRLTGRDDVVFGGTTAGRPTDIPGVESMVGLFINTVPVRARWDGDEHFQDLLQRIQETQVDLLPHEYLNLAVIQNLVGTGQLFDTLLVFQNYPADALSLHGPTERRVGNDVILTGMGGRDATHYPLTLTAMPDRFRLSYRPDLFDRSTAERLTERLIRVLRQVAADDGRRVEDFDLLLEGERDWLLGEVAVGDVPADSASTAVEAFAAQVAARPDATAVIAGENSWTYAELDARTNRLARHLLGLGLAPGDRAAVALPRSPDLIETFLAVTKTGATFVPIDTSHPPSRIKHLLTDSNPTLLITTSDFQPPTHPATQVLLDDPETAKEVAGRPSTPVDDTERGGSLTPASGFYLMYTSGSTGTPKGVLTPHSAVTALAADTTWAPFAGGRTLFHAPHTFDASTLEIWIPLLNGGTTVVAPPQAIDTTTLPELIRTQGLDAVHLTAGLFRVIAEEDPTALAGLPHLLTGGDTVPTHAITSVQAACPRLNIHHLYGPTETTLCATTHTLTPDHPDDIPNPLPLGRPRDGMRVYVLDHRLQPVPPGVTGELYLAGNGLAHGYLDQPHTTAERFTPDPHTTTPGARMYRTGDLARHTPQGHLQFLGRNDHQIKIRGHRIEPAEIENVLTNHPHIQSATVQPYHPTADTTQLIAYLTPTHPENPLVIAEIEAHLAAHLPDYMHPTHLITLPHLPLTPNGKIDTTQLPPPERETTNGEFTQPRTPHEEILHQLYTDVLNQPNISTHDSFFTLGGDSLQATRLISRIHTATGTHIPIRDLFQHPTIHALATHTTWTTGAARPALLPTPPRPDRPPLSHGQQRMWFLHHHEGPNPANNIPHATRLHGPLNTGALQAALHDVARRHEILRTLYRDNNGVPYQHILSPGDPEALPGLSVLPTTTATLDTYLAATLHQGFDIENELPWRATLHRISPTDHVLVLVVHHIAADGWSMGVLLQDLSTAYTARHNGNTPDWAPLPLQY
ncbi:amino acid adenylation domain-containing protein, partial [Streptomyces sp. B6B3]|uniref:non-ribosomal peptide synthetase n=1 Tax=Streptomyces sp. B6B3 TaxID=3153570 RepID=UPI00325E63B7